MDEEVIVAELVGLGWSRSTLAVWLRAKCRCEYCDCDLLASDGEYLYGSHVDHVVPGQGDDLQNLALACKTCNVIKRAKNFAEGVDGPNRRNEIIGRARADIQAQREKNRNRLERVKALITLLNADWLLGEGAV